MLTNGKARIKRHGDTLSLSVPSPKKWFSLIMGTIWLGGWPVGLHFALGTLTGFPTLNFDLSSFRPDLFILVWLAMWILGGAMVIFFLLWGFFGREKLTMDRTEMKLRKAILGVGFTRRMALADVSSIRFKEENYTWPFSSYRAYWGIGPGKIKIDYGMRTHSFALGVDDAEAHYLVRILGEGLPPRSTNTDAEYRVG